MKRIKILSTTILLLLVVGMTSTTIAQRTELPADHPKITKENFQKGPRIPDLSEEQEAKLADIHLNMMKEALPVKNLIKEKEARLNTLKTAEKADLAAINKSIDEISKLKADLAKKHAAKEQEIRKLLTDKQRIFFDTHQKPGRHHDKMSFAKHGHKKHDCDAKDDCKGDKYHKRKRK